MMFDKKILSRFKPADLNLPVLIKFISDWSLTLKKISPFASLLFILFNTRILIHSRKAIITVLLFLPFLFLNPSMDIVRFIFSICIFWIFLEKFNAPYTKWSPVMTGIVVVYSCIIFAGTFFSDYYLMMGGGALRYKFMLESHNALCIPVLISFIYLVNVLVQDDEEKGPAWVKPAVFTALLLLCIVLLLIKSRLYLGISFLMVLLVAIQNIRKSKLLIVIPVVYFMFFIAFAQYKQNFFPEGTTFRHRTAESYRMVDNSRIFSLSGTGRWGMMQAFFKTFEELGWQQFIYQNNTQAYLKNKAQLPHIDLKASTLTENAYMIVFLNTGFLGLLIFLFIFGYFAIHFFKRKEYLSLVFYLLLMGVWLFEETVMFPFSLICHLLALATVNRFERK